MQEVPLVAAILAHHPGWEGFALVIIPIVVIAAALAVVKRRVDALPMNDPMNDPLDDAAGPSAPGGHDEAGGHGVRSGDVADVIDVIDDISSR